MSSMYLYDHSPTPDRSENPGMSTVLGVFSQKSCRSRHLGTEDADWHGLEFTQSIEKDEEKASV